MKIKMSLISCLLICNSLFANESEPPVETPLDNITETISINENVKEIIPQLKQNDFKKVKRKDLYIELFENKNIEDYNKVKEAFHGYIPINRTRIINTYKVEILYSNIGKKVISNEDYNSVSKNIGKPLFINGLYFGTIKSIKLNENNNIEYFLENEKNLERIYQTDSTDKYWEDNFKLEESYIKNLKYKEKKYKWNNILEGYYPLEGSRFISDKKVNILEQSDTLLITDEIILPHEAVINKGKPLFVNGIYKGIIFIMMNYSSDKTMYVIKPADNLKEIYEKTPEYKNINKTNINKNLKMDRTLNKKESEDYKNLQIKNVQPIHFSALSSTLGFIPEVGSRFISTKFTNVNSIEKVNDVTFIITNENDTKDIKENILKPLFIDGIYQGVIEDIYSSNNNEMIYKLKSINKTNRQVLFNEKKSTISEEKKEKKEKITQDSYLYK